MATRAERRNSFKTLPNGKVVRVLNKSFIPQDAYRRTPNGGLPVRRYRGVMGNSYYADKQPGRSIGVVSRRSSN